MKKTTSIQNEPDDVTEEYDFSGGERGRYAKRFRSGSKVVVIDPDVARFFPNSESVNKALRSLAESLPQYARETEPPDQPQQK